MAPVVVFCEFSAAASRVRSRFPSVEVVDISKGIPPGVQGEVLFGTFGRHSAEAMSRGVRWVQLTGTGIDGVPPALLAAERVTSARGASAVGISEYVIAAMGAFVRGFPENWLRAAPERWNYQPGGTLAGHTLGLFGFGGIAQRIASIALAMDMSVVAIRRSATPSPIAGVEMASSVEQLFSSCDHLVLAAPATGQTHHVVNAESITWLRPGVHLVNIARGSLVDQDALRDALDREIVARASLDVTDPEPLPAGHWLYGHPRVFLTPHSSWVGPPRGAAATEIFLENLERYLAGQPLHFEVEPGGY